MLKIGILGAGHLGKIHLRLAEASPSYELVGFFDPDKTAVEQLVKEKGYTAFESPEALINAVDVVGIITPTLSHFEMAKKALLSKKHVFIEKPIAQTDQEAQTIVKLVKEQGVLGTVGHVERFNPAFQAVENAIEAPMFIESHRLAEFNPRGTDVSVVLDLMIHDIDIVLSLVKSPVKSIDASGVAVISETPDISNARVVFENGCVANFTASRISLKKMRKTRFFQKNAYIAVDYLTHKVEVVKIKDAPEIPDEMSLLLTNAEGFKKQIYFDNPRIESHNAIEKELEHFAECIQKNSVPRVTLADGAAALEVAHRIIQCIG